MTISAPALLAAVSTLSVVASAEALIPRFRAERLTLLEGGILGHAMAVNASGVVTGMSDDVGESTYPFAVLWPAPGDPVLIGGLGISGASGTGVADDGTVVGAMDEFAGAFVWTADTGPIPLETPGQFSTASGIAADGTIVGMVDVPFLSHRAAIWSDVETVTIYEPLDTVLCEGFDAAAGIIVGTSSIDGSRSVATRWVNGTPEALLDLGGAFGGAHDISDDASVIVGEAWQPGPVFGQIAAAFTVIDDVVSLLPTLGGDQAVARAYDDMTGHIVGRASLSGLTNFRAAIWVDGVPHDLNELVVTGLKTGEFLHEARDARNGFIAANGDHPYRLVTLAPTDVDGDGVTGVEDLVAVILNWGVCPVGTTCFPDVNQDGVVAVDDLLAVILAWT